MAYYGVEPYFWLKLIILLSIVGLSIFLFDIIMRKIFGLKRKKAFSYNHVNALHKKLDWIIRIIFIVIMIAGGIINISRPPIEQIFLLQPFVLLILLMYVTEILTAFMQWRNSENKKESIVTILGLAFITLLLFVVYTTDYLGLKGH